MIRNTTLRASIAALAILPAFSACTITMDTGKDDATPAQSAPAAQPSEQATDQTGSEASTQPTTTDDASTDAAQSDPTDDASESSSDAGTSAGGSGSEPTGEKVDVPAGKGLNRLDVIDIYGSPASGGAHGRITAVFKAETDRPLMLNIRIRLYDKAGNEIAENTGLNSVYTVGPQYLVTSNLIELPKGKTPHTFKAQLVDITDMSNSNGFSITKMPMPTVGKSSTFPKNQSLYGTVNIQGKVGSSVDVDGACIMPDGKIYHGSESISDNAVTGNTVKYEVPMYDADGVDLSQAKCYTSA